MVSDQPPYPFSARLVLLSAAAAGCLATLTQVILFRELMVILEGNELVLSLLLVWWLGGITIGALVPRGRWGERFLPHGLPLLVFGFPLLMMGCVLLARLSPGWLSLPVEEKLSPWQIGILSWMVVFPPGLFTGFLFPLLTMSLRMATDAAVNPPDPTGARLVGRVFLWESLGSLGAGLLLVMQIIPRWSPAEIAWMAGSILAVMYIAWADSRRWQMGGILGIVFLLITGWFARWAEDLDRWSAAARWQTRHPGYELILTKETPYQRLEAGLREEQYTVFGNGSPLFSFPDEYGMTYWGAMSVSQTPGARRILLVGSGGPDLYRVFAHMRPERFQVLEISPDIVSTVQALGNRDEALDGLPSPEWIVEDARRFFAVPQEDLRYDLIAVNQPDPLNGLLNRYYTREFFEQAWGRLREDGVLAITATGTPNYERGDTGLYCGTLYWTLRDVFPHVLVVPGTTWWFFASPGRNLMSDPGAVVQQFQERGGEALSFPPEIYYSFYDPARIQQAQEALETFHHLPRNRDDWPLCYLYNLIAWSKQYGYLKDLSISEFIHTGIPLTIGCVIITLCLFGTGYGILRFVFPRRGRAAFPAWVLLFMTGLTSMGAELCILLYFQSRVGYLYVHAGLFFGVYMGGLAAGSAWALRHGPRGNDAQQSLLPGTAALFAGMLMLTPAWLELTRVSSVSLFLVEGMLLLWLVLLAALTGMIFTRVAGAVRHAGLDLAWTAGWTDAGDCAGGAVGAWLTGVILVPLAGLSNTLYMMGGLVALSSLAQIRQSRE